MSGRKIFVDLEKKWYELNWTDCARSRFTRITRMTEWHCSVHVNYLPNTFDLFKSTCNRWGCQAFGFNHILSINFCSNVWMESQSELRKNFCEGSKKVDYHQNLYWLNLISPVKRTIHGFLNLSFFLRFQTFNSLWYQFWTFLEKGSVVCFKCNYTALTWKLSSLKDCNQGTQLKVE